MRARLQGMGVDRPALLQPSGPAPPMQHGAEHSYFPLSRSVCGSAGAVMKALWSPLQFSWSTVQASRGGGGGGGGSRRRDCHFDYTPCLSLLKHLIKVQGGAIK